MKNIQEQGNSLIYVGVPVSMNIQHKKKIKTFFFFSLHLTVMRKFV